MDGFFQKQLQALQETKHFDGSQDALVQIINSKNSSETQTKKIEKFLNTQIESHKELDRSFGTLYVFLLAKYGSLHLMHLLQRAGIEINVLNDEIEGYSALHYAVFENNLSKVNFLIEAGININLQDTEGKTALHYAVFLEDLTILKYLLLKKENDLTIQDCQGNTFLNVAIEYTTPRNVQTIYDFLYSKYKQKEIKKKKIKQVNQFFLKKNSLQYRNFLYLMYDAIDRDDKSFIDFFLNFVSFDELFDIYEGKTTLLHVAVSLGRMYILEWCLEENPRIDIWIEDDQKRSPLQIAPPDLGFCFFKRYIDLRWKPEFEEEVMHKSFNDGTFLLK